MPVKGPIVEIPPPAPVPELLVELPRWHRVFLGNLRDLVAPASQEPLQLRSAPAPFWPDVFVKRSLPMDGFVRSFGCHVAALGVVLGVSHLSALQPRVETRPVFQKSDVIYYSPAEYLPPLDTRSPSAPVARKADPVLSHQTIISVPAEAENHSQTIVTPPNIKLKRDVAIPNIVSWSDRQQKPRLAIPAAPLTPASEITRIAPKLDTPVVAPPVDAARLDHRRLSPALQNSVVAPPPDIHAGSTSTFHSIQTEAIAPPPTVDASSNRAIGGMNIAPSTVIAPAPQLPVAAQRTLPGGGLAGAQGQVVPPPPSVGASGTSGSSFGSRGQVIALSLHPAVGAPPDPPAGNRRGSFAAGPEGHAGASGTPGSATGAASGGAAPGNSKGNGSGAAGKEAGSVPSGLYVANAGPKPSPVAGNGSSANTVNPNLIASVRPPRVTAAKPMPPDSSAKLTEAEHTVFGNRRFYSVSLNMPNLNSAGGSWVIRFAELNPETDRHGVDLPAPDLTQPMPTRKVDPAYPIQLMRENVAGTVILYAVIHADGTVGSVRVLTGVDERLNRFASEAIAQWKFDPATKNGAPVDVEATFHIPFRPAKVGSNF